MSKQRSILNALNTALTGITGVNLVTEDLTAWSSGDPQNYNMVLISTKKPEVDRLSYLHPTSEDMMAEMEITIEGNTFSQYEADVSADLDYLMVEVEKAIVGNVALKALVTDIYLSNDEFVYELTGRYGLFSAVYTVEYLYNHNSP